MSRHPSWSLAVESSGLRYRTAVDGGRPLQGDLESVLAQWEDEGFAARDGDAWFVGWDALYEMLDGGAYDDVRSAAGIPDTVGVVPRLSSAGSLTDATFSISIAGWYTSNGAPVDAASIIGAYFEAEDQHGLLAKPVWEVLRLVQNFGQRPAEERDGRSQRLAWGRIRRAALKAGARLDDFLYRTVVLAPERLKIELRKAELTGNKVVEVVPGFDGSPEGWLGNFDRMTRVQDRYDLATPDGIVQVVVSPDVRTVLEQVKRMPGRRVAGVRAEAFLANPFATLGETAAKVIDAEQFEQAKTSAGLQLDHFTAYVESDERGHPTELGLLIETGAGVASKSIRVPFGDDAEADKFISTVRGRIARELQICPWGEFELELLGDSEDQLKVLEGALEVRRGAASRVDSAGQRLRSVAVLRAHRRHWRREAVCLGVHRPKRRG